MHAKPRLWNTLPGAARTREVGGVEATEQASAALGEADYGVIWLSSHMILRNGVWRERGKGGGMWIEQKRNTAFLESPASM